MRQIIKCIEPHLDIYCSFFFVNSEKLVEIKVEKDSVVRHVGMRRVFGGLV